MDVYGPSLPPGFKPPSDNDSESEDEQPKKKSKIIGPQIPSDLILNRGDDRSSASENEDEEPGPQIIGPVLPKTFKKRSDEKNEDDVYGPMPPETKVDYDVVGLIEKRARKMKDKLDNKDAPVAESVKREEWMIVPDTSRRNQLGAISRCLAPGSTKQKEEKKESTSRHNPEEDKKYAKALKKYNKSKRAESLLEMHTKKLKKKKKEKKSERPERKPFDREEMAVRHFTQQQVNSVIDKAKYLNSRFGPGRDRYL